MKGEDVFEDKIISEDVVEKGVNVFEDDVQENSSSKETVNDDQVEEAVPSLSTGRRRRKPQRFGFGN